MSTSLFDLTGKVALVTGATHGLGMAMAKGIGKAGATVIINGNSSQEKIDNAVSKTCITQIAIAGGVSANSGLRKALLEREKTHKWNVFIPKFEYCTDNAAMIAISGYYKFQDEQFASSSVTANARMKL